MGETLRASTLDIDESNEVDLQTEQAKKYALGAYGLEVYTRQAGIIKEKIDKVAAEISQRQERIKLLHQILQGINKLSDENGLDISKHPELMAKLKNAKELGIDINETQTKFSGQERDFLKETLHMAAEDYTNENKVQTQKMQVLIQESDRWLMLANAMVKTDERIKKRIIERMK